MQPFAEKRSAEGEIERAIKRIAVTMDRCLREALEIQGPSLREPVPRDQAWEFLESCVAPQAGQNFTFEHKFKRLSAESKLCIGN